MGVTGERASVGDAARRRWCARAQAAGDPSCRRVRRPRRLDARAGRRGRRLRRRRHRRLGARAVPARRPTTPPAAGDGSPRSPRALAEAVPRLTRRRRGGAGVSGATVRRCSQVIPSPAQGVWHLGPFPVRAYALCILVGIVVGDLDGRAALVARGGPRGRGGRRRRLGGAVRHRRRPALPRGLVAGRVLRPRRRPGSRRCGSGRAASGSGVRSPSARVGGVIGCRRAGVRLRAVRRRRRPRHPARPGDRAPRQLVQPGAVRHARPTCRGALAIDPRLPAGRATSSSPPSTRRSCTSCCGTSWPLPRAALGGPPLPARARPGVLGATSRCTPSGGVWIEALRIDDAERVLGLRLNIWTSIAAVPCWRGHLRLSARRHPGRETRRGCRGPAAAARTQSTPVDGVVPEQPGDLQDREEASEPAGPGGQRRRPTSASVASRPDAEVAAIGGRPTAALSATTPNARGCSRHQAASRRIQSHEPARLATALRCSHGVLHRTEAEQVEDHLAARPGRWRPPARARGPACHRAWPPTTQVGLGVHHRETTALARQKAKVASASTRHPLARPRPRPARRRVGPAPALSDAGRARGRPSARRRGQVDETSRRVPRVRTADLGYVGRRRDRAPFAAFPSCIVAASFRGASADPSGRPAPPDRRPRPRPGNPAPTASRAAAHDPRTVPVQSPFTRLSTRPPAQGLYDRAARARRLRRRLRRDHARHARARHRRPRAHRAAQPGPPRRGRRRGRHRRRRGHPHPGPRRVPARASSTSTCRRRRATPSASRSCPRTTPRPPRPRGRGRADLRRGGPDASSAGATCRSPPRSSARWPAACMPGFRQLFVGAAALPLRGLALDRLAFCAAQAGRARGRGLLRRRCRAARSSTRGC